VLFPSSANAKTSFKTTATLAISIMAQYPLQTLAILSLIPLHPNLRVVWVYDWLADAVNPLFLPWLIRSVIDTIICMFSEWENELNPASPNVNECFPIQPCALAIIDL
jgi:hypothetical protein